MVKSTLDLRTPPVVAARQRDPEIPRTNFSEHTKSSFIKVLGKELLTQTLHDIDGFYSTQERLNQTNEFKSQVSPKLENIKTQLLTGGNPNMLLEQSEKEIRSYFNNQRTNVHGKYWANILEKEALIVNRTEFTDAMTTGIKQRQADLIDETYKTYWLQVDKDPSNVIEAMSGIDRLEMDYLRNTGDLKRTAMQAVQWRDDLALSAIKNAGAASLEAGQMMFDGLTKKMSVPAIEKAKRIMDQLAQIHTKQNMKMEAIAESAQRVQTMMDGQDALGNPVFIDPNNKQNQIDMDNDYGLLKLQLNKQLSEENPENRITPEEAFRQIRNYTDKVERTGIIPSDYESDMRSYLNSGDISLVKSAASDIERITRSGMKMSKKLDNDMVADSVTIMRWARSGVPDATIMDRLVNYRKLRIEQKEYRENTLGQKIKNDKRYLQDITSRTFVQRFYQVGPFAPPQTPPEFEVAAAEAVKDYYIYQGADWEDAKVAAAHDLRQSWGITTMMNGRDTYMLYPPEMTYPGPVESYIPGESEHGVLAESVKPLPERMHGQHWTQIALREEIKTWDMQKKYDPNQIVLDFDSTSETEGKILYKLMYRTKLGTLEEVMTKRGGVYQPALWYPEPKFYISYRDKRKKQAATENPFIESMGLTLQ